MKLFFLKVQALQGLVCVAQAINAHVAQLVEHFLGKGEVTGSIPVAGSILESFYYGKK